MRNADCGIRNVKTTESHFIHPNPTERPQSTERGGQKTQKPIPPYPMRIVDC
jgi:hypothetical protein